jgi:hypothetical protein
MGSCLKLAGDRSSMASAERDGVFRTLSRCLCRPAGRCVVNFLFDTMHRSQRCGPLATAAELSCANAVLTAVSRG